MRLRPRQVSMQGFETHVIYAASRGQAFRDSYNAYGGMPFGNFIQECRIRLAADAPDPRFGDRILVNGRPWFFAYSDRAYVYAVQPGGDHLSCIHPYEVEDESYRPYDYRSKAA